MTNKHTASVAVALVVLALPNTFRAAEPLEDFSQSVAVLSAPGQPTLHRKQLLAMFYRCAVELKVQDRLMPRVVVVSAGAEEADVADVSRKGHIFIEHHPQSGNIVYMAWIVGRPRDSDIIEVFVKVLNNAFAIGLSPEQVDAMVKRLYAEHSATIEVNSMLEEHR
ncbi:MAG TPA: hypothetical protein VG498_15175 [Terriglobales bacterium]|nr:hypothetical protein [Terriglobales bacterium]